jgi:hypothetical protein
MMPDGQVVFEITADKKPIGQALNDTTRMIQQESGKWDQAAKQSTDNIGNNFSSMFKKISAAALAIKAGQALLDLGKDAIAAASDLREVQNVVDVTFGSNAGQIETWAKNASAQFGLTETQAKKFTSTLGAMMKSAGLAGPEIVNMSTDLAGLAADMASFYNLDFETAFSKIRSGISGETEPLKQLGVNMSVANLEAYALSKGITKAFNDMSQGEQTMLRYQYLMQATADAQGDFARTSDGYANSMRRIDTALTSIKTSIGKTFLPIVEAATTGLADFIEKITAPKPHTVLDEFAEINLDTENKLKEIEATATKANDLVDVLKDIAGSAVDVNKTSGLLSFIESFSGKITGLDGALQKAKENNVKGAISDLADALSANLGGDPDKWKNLLTAIKDNAGGAINAVSGDSGSTKLFLEGVAAGADDLTTDYSTYWTKLLSALGNNAADAITALAGGDGTGAILTGIASGANGLQTDAGDRWKLFVDALGGLAGKDDVPKNLSDIAKALSNNLGGKAEQWETLLGVISDKLPGAGIAASMDGGKTASFMVAAAAAADDLGEDYSELWHKLLTVLGDDAPDAVNALLLAGSTGTNLSSIAAGANVLNANSPQTWTDLLGALQKVDGLSNIFSSSGAGNVKSLADALSGNAPDADKAAAWQTFLDALGTNTDALSKLTGKSADETSAWLQKMKEAANGLNPTDAEAWNKLLANFVNGLPGLKDTEGGKAFFDSMAEQFLSMGTESEEAKKGLLSLGWSTDQISEKQRLWLAVCKQLVSTIPGLSSIIDTQTGEVKGGTAAINEYIKSWNDLMSRDIMMEAVRQKKEALAAEFSNLPELAAQAAPYAVKLKEARKKFEDALGGRTYNPYGNAGDQANLDALYKSYAEANAAFNKAYAPYKERKDAYDQALSLLTDQEQAMKELGYTADETAESVEDTAGAMTTLEKAASGEEAAMKDVTAALENAQAAFKALADYQDSVRTETARTVGSVIKGFDSIITPATKARDKMKELELANKRFTKEGTFTLEYKEAAGNVPTAQNMLSGLQSQLDYITEYRAAMDKAMAAGASEELLAYLSDGTAESLDYLKALADGSADIKKLNDAYRQVQEESASFTNELTQQKLAVDETYKGMKDAATDAVVKLNMYDGAKESVEATVQGIVDGLGEQKENVQKQVDEILAQIARLQGQSGFGANFVIGNASGALQWFSGSHANGLDYVPYDGYFAMLHQGERVQTAAEAELSRRYENQAPGADIGGAIRAGMGNMQIIWRGRVVADVLSEQQGDSYRALERSGWKS